MQHLILLHGALGSRHDLHHLAERVQSEGFQTHAFSFSGHDGQNFRNNFGIEQFAEELKEFIGEKNMHQPTIFGYSMGGYVALHCAQQNQGLTGKIITLGTKFSWNAENADRESQTLVPEKLQQKVPHYVSDLQQKHGENWKELLRQTARMIKELGAANLLDEKRLASIANPVLLGRGDKDRMVSFEETQMAAHCLPNAGLYMLPYTAHGMDTANITILSSIVCEFLRREN